MYDRLKDALSKEAGAKAAASKEGSNGGEPSSKDKEKEAGARSDEGKSTGPTNGQVTAPT